MKDNRRGAETVCAVMEMGVDLADSDTAVSDFLSQNRRAINEIRRDHPDLGDRLKTHVTRRRAVLTAPAPTPTIKPEPSREKHHGPHQGTLFR